MLFLKENAFEIFKKQVFKCRNVDNAIDIIFRLFKEYLPLDAILLATYDSQRGAMRYIGFATDGAIQSFDETVVLTERTRKHLNKDITHEILVIENFLDHPVSIEVSKHFGRANTATYSGITIFIELEPPQYCLLSLMTFSLSMYKTDHIKLVEELFEPVAGVMRHIMAQLEIKKMKEHLIQENESLLDRFIGRSIIGASTGLKEVMSLMEQAAPLGMPILILGETGVGKEVAANVIHRLSQRSDGPMVCINCGAIPDSLLDSELFGHEKGAFTGADKMRQGYFERADRGTIFMDEIGELSLQAQVKLLRVIQDMTFHRVGGTRAITTDARVIAATNRDIESLIKNHQFRKDLWYRINVFPIRIPPLRERISDIPLFAEYFLRRKSMEIKLPFHSRFAIGAMEQLQAYDWPGNVRELQNVIERALITSQGEPLSFPNLVGKFSDCQAITTIFEDTPYPTLEEITARHIQQTILKTGGRISGKDGAADLLGMNPSTLRSRMRKLGIQLLHIPNNARK